MTFETIYNPVHPLTPLDRVSDFYWSNRMTVAAATVGFLFGAVMAAAWLASL